jgi:Na+-transporting methylmalonyl-CoA/oxaloacetate decarboxylase gamma subunit
MTAMTFGFSQNQATRDAISQQVRDQINAAREEALAAAKAARNATTPSPAPLPGAQPVTIQQIPWNPDSDIPPRVMGLGVAFLVCAAAVLILMPFTRAISRAIDRSKPRASVPSELTSQLAQLSQAVDAIAVEVERISEGQRFTTRLLSEQQRNQSGTLLSPTVGGDRPGGGLG